MLKKLLFIVFLINSIYANEVLFSLGIIGADNKSSIYNRSDGYSTYGDTSSAALSMSLGIGINLASNFSFEPEIGYRSYNTDGYNYGSYFTSLPLLYTFDIYSQNIKIGPNIKFFMNENIKSELHSSDQITSSETNGACGLDIILEFHYIDLYLSYEYLLKPIVFYGSNGTNKFTGRLDIQGDYIGYGIRIKY